MDNRQFESGASASPPSPPASPSAGYPTNGNPGTGTPATVPGEYWFHQVGEELRAIIVAAGLTPDEANLDQVLQAMTGRLLRTTVYINDAGTLKASIDGEAFAPASSTFTPHNLTKRCDVEVLGGGGGGGGSAATSAGQISGGTGGAGGGYTRGWLTSGFDGATVTVGAGGAPGIAGATGGNGGTSSFGAALSATGGGGGSAGTAGTTGANVGPLGGTGTGGAINIRGETGEGPFGIGSVPIIRSGRGGGSLYGAGGNNAVSFASGGAASGYGAGGGGSACPPSTASPASGGSGTGGLIIVREYS